MPTFTSIPPPKLVWGAAHSIGVMPFLPKLSKSLSSRTHTSVYDDNDQSLARIGPLSSEVLAQLEAGNITLDLWRFGVFRHRAIRIAFESFQGRQCRRRTLGYAVCFGAFQVFIGVMKAIDVSAVSDAMCFSGPVWYSMIILVYIGICAALIHSIPKLARGKLKFLDSPRAFDLILCICILGYLAMVPRVYWDGSDPWNIATRDKADDASTAKNFMYMSVAVSTVIAGGGAFYNPVIGVAVANAWIAVVVQRSRSLCDAYMRLNSTAAPRCAGEDRMEMVPLWPLLVAIIVIIAYHESTVTLQFTYAVAMQRMAVQRIEQLAQEKERLDYERRMEEQKVDQMSAQLAITEGHTDALQHHVVFASNAGGASVSSGSIELTHIMTQQLSSPVAERDGARPALRPHGSDSGKGSIGGCGSESPVSCLSEKESSEATQWISPSRNAALEKTLAESGLLR